MNDNRTVKCQRCCGYCSTCTVAGVYRLDSMRTAARPEGVSDKAGHPVFLVQAIINTLLISAAWRPIIALLTGSLISVLMDNNSPSQNHKYTLELSGFSVKHRPRQTWMILAESCCNVLTSWKTICIVTKRTARHYNSFKTIHHTVSYLMLHIFRAVVFYTSVSFPINAKKLVFVLLLISTAYCRLTPGS
jgi:hypothetical protein